MGHWGNNPFLSKSLCSACLSLTWWRECSILIKMVMDMKLAGSIQTMADRSQVSFHLGPLHDHIWNIFKSGQRHYSLSVGFFQTTSCLSFCSFLCSVALWLCSLSPSHPRVFSRSYCFVTYLDPLLGAASWRQSGVRPLALCPAAL